MWALWFDEQPVLFTRDADGFRDERAAVDRLARSDQERFRFGPWEGAYPLPVEQQASSERMVACFRTLAKDEQYAEWMRRAVDGGYAMSGFALALSDA